MRPRCGLRPAPGPRPACLVALLLLAIAAAAAGCARRDGDGRAGAAADTLANGLPRALVPGLRGWTHAWGLAMPGFAAESLAATGRGPWRFESPRAGEGLRYVESLRTRALVLVLSPDSTRAVDFDRYLDVQEQDGGPEFGRGPDSSPVLLDFAGDTLWTVDFCGTPCFYDGAYWVDASRFALTGATRSGEQADGPWQAFLQVHDLRTQECARWLGRPVDGPAFARYQAAYDAMLRARLARAALGRPATPDTGAGPIATAR